MHFSGVEELEYQSSMHLQGVGALPERLVGIIDHRSSFTRLGEIASRETYFKAESDTPLHRANDSSLIHRCSNVTRTIARGGYQAAGDRHSIGTLAASRLFAADRRFEDHRERSRSLIEARRLRERTPSSRRVRKIPRNNGTSSTRRPQFVSLSSFLSLPTEKLRVTTNAASRTQCSLISFDSYYRDTLASIPLIKCIHCFVSAKATHTIAVHDARARLSLSARELDRAAPPRSVRDARAECRARSV